MSRVDNAVTHCRVILEIPIFHILNARITFGNIFSADKPVEGVSKLTETRQREEEDGQVVTDTAVTSCSVDETVFAIPDGYRTIGSVKYYFNHISLSSQISEKNCMLQAEAAILRRGIQTRTISCCSLPLSRVCCSQGRRLLIN